jgi:hypothetical protein
MNRVTEAFVEKLRSGDRNVQGQAFLETQG